MNIIYRGRRTHKYQILCDARAPEGTQETRRNKGYSDYDDITNLIRAGYLEVRYSGPRGGTRYHATRKGKLAQTRLAKTSTW